MKTTKKLLAVVLAAVMLLCVMPLGVFADEVLTTIPQGVWVAGKRVDSDKETYWLNDNGSITSTNATADNYNVKYTPATETADANLTLKNANLSDSVVYKYGSYDYMSAVVYVYAQKDVNVTITLEGSNAITAKPELITTGYQSNNYIYGIKCADSSNRNASATVIGDGSLEIKAEQNTIDDYYSSVAVNGADALNVAGKAKVTIDAKVNKVGNQTGYWTGAYAVKILNVSEKATVKATASSNADLMFIYAANSVEVSDKANVFLSGKYAFENAEVNGGTFEAIGTTSLSSGTSNDLDLYDSRRCSVRLNTEATADGAKRWNGDEKKDEDFNFVGEDFTVRVDGYKYIKVKYYPQPLSTISLVSQTMWNLFRVFVKYFVSAFINFPIRFYNSIKIIVENIGDYIDYYNK
ncbi:MAG: hypothetical protein IJF40_01620 [Clostridia bacterium]|nr:hypothetical protein [Clostridia bacterium]